MKKIFIDPNQNDLSFQLGFLGQRPKQTKPLYRSQSG